MAATAPKCPYLAINIPGERPFVVERKLYDSATKGINIVDTTLTKSEGSGLWVLTIKHESGRTHKSGRRHGTLKFYNQLQTRFKSAYEYMKFKEGLADWAARAHQNRQAVAASPHQKQIKRLEKELSKLYAHRPISPLRVGRECVREGDREYCGRWRKGRSERMQLALIGGWVLKGVVSPLKAYRLAEEAGYKVQKFSKVRGSYREWLGVHNENDYWKSLYRFTSGLTHKRKQSFPETPLTDQLTAHRESLIQFLVHNREIESIKTQIESIKALAADIVPAANETGVVYA